MNLYKNKHTAELQIRLMTPSTHPEPLPRNLHVISLGGLSFQPLLVSHAWKTQSKFLPRTSGVVSGWFIIL